MQDPGRTESRSYPVLDRLFQLVRPQRRSTSARRQPASGEADSDRMIPIDKEHLRQLRKTFERLTKGQATGDTKPIFDESRGIYPLVVGGRLRGVRLCRGTTLATSGSVCLQAMIHTNEPAGLAGLQEVLDLWNGVGRHADHPLYKRRDELPGDVLLMIPGKPERGEQFFNRLLDPVVTEISLEELTSFRLTEDWINLNRLPDGPPTETAPQSLIDLWNDFQELNESLYKTCYTKPEDLEKGAHPGFIFGFHTFSQPGEPTALAYFFPFPEPMTEEGNIVLRKVEDYVQTFCAMIGARAVIIENHHVESERGEYYFEGVSRLNPNDLENPITTGSPIRGTLECGQHLDPMAVRVAQNVALNALEYKLGPDLVRGAERPREHNMTFYSDTELWFAPGSPLTKENPHFRRLTAPLNNGEAFGDLYLITGYELSPDERNTWTKQRLKQERFDELPEVVWQAILAAKPGQLANGKELKKGQAIAWVDIIGPDGTIRQAVIRAPNSVSAFMAPKAPRVRAKQQEYVLHVSQHKRQVTIKFGRNRGQTSERYGDQTPINGFDRRNTRQQSAEPKFHLAELIANRLPGNRRPRRP